MPGSHRRRCAGALVVAFVSAGIALLGLRAAAAQTPTTTCSRIFQTDCPTTTTEPSTTTIDDEETTTTAQDRGDYGGDDGSDQETTTTQRRTATTERVTTTTFAVSTSLNLLVPGDGTAGAESTTTTEQGRLVEREGGLSDNQLVALIVGGSTVVGAAVALLTWRYWRATQPVEVPVEPVDPDRGANGGRPSGGSGRTQRSVFYE